MFVAATLAAHVGATLQISNEPPKGIAERFARADRWLSKLEVPFA
jgi:hypothetical protein